MYHGDVVMRYVAFGVNVFIVLVGLESLLVNALGADYHRTERVERVPANYPRA